MRCVAGLMLGLLVTPALAIVNGRPVSQPRFLADYSWAVALENPLSGGVCSAALVSPTWVVTAAHCTAIYKYVLVGNTARSRARKVGVAEAIRHPGYDSVTHQFDVGLLRLSEPVDDLQALPLISRGEAMLLLVMNAPAQVLGWGKTPGAGFSDRLVAADIYLRNLAFLGTDLVFVDRAGPCGGDSGGPLVVQSLDRTPVLVGVASTTDGNLCAKGGGLAAYTHVDVIRSFIREHVDDLPGSQGRNQR